MMSYIIAICFVYIYMLVTHESNLFSLFRCRGSDQENAPTPPLAAAAATAAPQPGGPQPGGPQAREEQQQQQQQTSWVPPAQDAMPRSMLPTILVPFFFLYFLIGSIYLRFRFLLLFVSRFCKAL